MAQHSEEYGDILAVSVQNDCSDLLADVAYDVTISDPPVDALSVLSSLTFASYPLVCFRYFRAV